MPKYTDEEWIELISKDNRAAFEALFRTYYSELCKSCIKYVRVLETAEEIVQDVFVSFWERRYELDITTSLRAYLFSSVRNRALNHLRIQLPKELLLIDTDDAPPEALMVSDAQMDQEMLQQFVRDAIDRLPNKCKVIFDLSRNAGLTYQEIAEELDISVKTVENHIGLALKRLREDLKPAWERLIVIVILFLV